MVVVRFLIGSILLFVGPMVGLLGAISVVGLPLGVIVMGAGLQLLVGGSARR